MQKSLVILILATAMMFGCQADQNSDKKADQSMNQTEETTESGQNQAEITGTYWKLASLQNEQVPMNEDQREAHIMLKPEEQKVTGSGGCNVLNGNYELGNNNSISFSKMAVTKMSCAEMETEDKFLTVFEKVDTYQIKDDTLVLKDSNDKTLATLVSAPGKEK